MVHFCNDTLCFSMGNLFMVSSVESKWRTCAKIRRNAHFRKTTSNFFQRCTVQEEDVLLLGGHFRKIILFQGCHVLGDCGCVHSRWNVHFRKITSAYIFQGCLVLGRIVDSRQTTIWYNLDTPKHGGIPISWWPHGTRTLVSAIVIHLVVSPWSFFFFFHLYSVIPSPSSVHGLHVCHRALTTEPGCGTH